MYVGYPNIKFLTPSLLISIQYCTTVRALYMYYQIFLLFFSAQPVSCGQHMESSCKNDENCKWSSNMCVSNGNNFSILNVEFRQETKLGSLKINKLEVLSPYPALKTQGNILQIKYWKFFLTHLFRLDSRYFGLNPCLQYIPTYQFSKVGGDSDYLVPSRLQNFMSRSIIGYLKFESVSPRLLSTTFGYEF